MTFSLTHMVAEKTYQRFEGTRIFDSTKQIFKNHGIAKGVGVVAAMAVSKAALGAISFFCIKGSVLALKSLNEDKRPLVGYSPAGNVGGWSIIPPGGFLIYKDSLAKMTYEGEFLKVVDLFKQWIKENNDPENPLDPKKIYKEMNGILNAFSQKCLFPKSAAEREYIVLEIIRESKLKLEIKSNLKQKKIKIKEEDFLLKQQLEPILNLIRKEIKEKTSLKNIFKRIYHGERSASTKGFVLHTSTLIYGIALPILFVMFSGFSSVGEIGLATEIARYKTGKGETGHLGEWPLNILEGIVAAIYLLMCYLVYEGDFRITRIIYESHLDALKDKPKLYNALVKIANADLLERANLGEHFKLPNQYQFTKI